MTTCPSCGANAAGRFCSSCGAIVTGGPCPECSTVLSPGARFCHRCGAASVSRPVRRKSADTALPWAVAAIALVALTALVAGRRFSASERPADIPVAADAATDGVVRGPDISQMTPAQRAESLFDRMMRLNDAGQVDSVRFFAPMAIAAYQLIDALNDDQRYDLGRIGLMTGLVDLAQAQSDTILARNPQHLLGLALGISVAKANRQPLIERQLRKRLLSARDTELAKNLTEYQVHRADILKAIEIATP